MTALEASALDRFRAVLARRTGLSFDESRLASLDALFRRRGGTTPGGVEGLLARLEAPVVWRDELRALAPELTIAETYFFRNPDHFHALLGLALPARMRARAPGETLRLLSAGCASGEEAYSLAILVRGGLEPGREVSICGIDLNPGVLEKAARGQYSKWALRGTSTEVRSRWFRAQGQDFVLDASVRAMVTFEERNLTEDDPVFWQEGRYDVIFCRNVIMYLTPEAARGVVARFARALAPGGFLFLGHAETLRGISQQFHLRHTHEAFYYERRSATDDAQDGQDPPAVATSGAPTAAPSPQEPRWEDSWIETVRGASERIAALAATARAPDAPEATKDRAVGAHSALVQAIELMRQERVAEAQLLINSIPAESRSDPDVLLLRAVLHTHGGDLGEAARVSAELLTRDELNAGAHYVMALCRESAGDVPGAVQHDQLAAYLDPSFAMPRLHLGLLARRAGDAARARGEFAQALWLLEREDSARVLLFGGGFSREALAAVCRAELLAWGDAMTDARFTNRAAELRRTFDRSFIGPLIEEREEVFALLGVRVGDAGYALRLAELAGLFVARTIVPLPSSSATLLGLAGIRGVATPVYSLHALLGHPPSPAPPRWIVLARAEPVGLAFDELDGHLLVLRSELSPVQGDTSRAHVRETARVATTMHPVVSVPSLVGTIKAQIGVADTIKER